MSTTRFELRRAGGDEAGGDAVAVLVLTGEVDADNAGALERALAEVAERALILDLSDVAYFGSAGFELLDRVLARGAAVVIPPGSVVRRAAMLMNVPAHPTVAEAQAAVRGAWTTR